ncbi:metalloprotease [Halorarius halobius]|uniref:metalloprotease n=1 Tax=Halorarius halobius TaxID=2962671 RepID=UPI0020CF630E|nr:metalloprotease [Halorarius halobius]
MNVEFSGRELRDITVAWAALGVAFTLFILQTNDQYRLLPDPTTVPVGFLTRVFVGSLLTVGVGFLLHELAHKVVAIHYGQVAAFKADYGMLGIAVLGGLAGFLFAAPGAVVHRGRVSPREHAFIAVAGPLVNVALAALFVVPWLLLSGMAGEIAQLGVTVNAVLAGFNMIPFGPLDGRKVRQWSTAGFAAAFLLCVGVALAAFLFVGFPF